MHRFYDLLIVNRNIPLVFILGIFDNSNWKTVEMI